MAEIPAVPRPIAEVAARLGLPAAAVDPYGRGKAKIDPLLAGTAGSVPVYGYHVLSQAPEAALAILTPALQDEDGARRERAINAISSMGRAAVAAKPALEAARMVAEAREAQLLDTCIQQIGG